MRDAQRYDLDPYPRSRSHGPNALTEVDRQPPYGANFYMLKIFTVILPINNSELSLTHHVQV